MKAKRERRKCLTKSSSITEAAKVRMLCQKNSSAGVTSTHRTSVTPQISYKTGYCVSVTRPAERCKMENEKKVAEIIQICLEMSQDEYDLYKITMLQYARYAGRKIFEQMASDIFALADMKRPLLLEVLQ